MRRACILGLSLFGCGWPDGLPETASPGVMRGGLAYPDLRVTAARHAEGRRDAAIIVTIEDYTTLADRPNAHGVAAAWYRYIRETRRVRRSRITVLRDGEATREAITEALERAHYSVGRTGTVWFVFVGHVSGTLPGKYGALWLQAGDGTPATLQQQAFSAAAVLSRLGHGLHPRTIAVFDGCLTGGPESLSSGTETPELPAWVYRGEVDDIPVIPKDCHDGSERNRKIHRHRHLKGDPARRARPGGAGVGDPERRRGRGRLIERLVELKPELIVMEPSGGYEIPLAGTLGVAQLPVAVVDARQIRDFAKATGKLAKTDKIDARMIALFAERLRPEPRPLADEETVQVDALIRRRKQVQESLITEPRSRRVRRDRPALSHEYRTSLLHVATRGPALRQYAFGTG